MFIYKDSINGIDLEKLKGFFAGWPNPPSAEILLKLLSNSDKVIVAIDSKTNNVVGFITAITDIILSAYIPFLEVLPDYQNQGIGKELMNRMLKKLEDFYMIDLVCDDEMESFYKKFGMKAAKAMSIRNYSNQSGK